MTSFAKTEERGHTVADLVLSAVKAFPSSSDKTLPNVEVVVRAYAGVEDLAASIVRKKHIPTT